MCKYVCRVINVPIFINIDHYFSSSSTTLCNTFFSHANTPAGSHFSSYEWLSLPSPYRSSFWTWAYYNLIHNAVQNVAVKKNSKAAANKFGKTRVKQAVRYLLEAEYREDKLKYHYGFRVNSCHSLLSDISSTMGLKIRTLYSSSGSSVISERSPWIVQKLLECSF